MREVQYEGRGVSQLVRQDAGHNMVCKTRHEPTYVQAWASSANPCVWVWANSPAPMCRRGLARPFLHEVWANLFEPSWAYLHGDRTSIDFRFSVLPKTSNLVRSNLTWQRTEKKVTPR